MNKPSATGDTQLAPCPICARTPTLSETHCHECQHTTGYLIKCVCGVYMMGKHEANLRDAWNMRAGSAKPCHCGSPASIKNEAAGYYAQCRDNPKRHFGRYAPTRAGAIEVWNQTPDEKRGVWNG